MAFSNIENSEKLEIINIAIIDNEDFKNNEIMKEVFKTLSDEKNEDRLFETKYTTKEEASELLENGDITGYMILEENNPKLIFKSNGINETIFKSVVDEITENTEIITNLMEDRIKNEVIAGNYNIDYEKIYNDIAQTVEDKDIRIKNISNSNLSYTMIEFYTLIAMACLYGGILGMTAINQNLANMSSNGKRVRSSSYT